jgi:hypothetical protein
MPDRQILAVYFEYDDGAEVAVGAHAQEVMDYLNAGQSMNHIHGHDYTGRQMREVPSLGLSESMKEKEPRP